MVVVSKHSWGVVIVLLMHVYSNLIGACETRNGKPKSIHGRCKKEGFEKHHITARSMGGTDHHYNLVYLTPREHYLAHHILARLYGGSMISAFWLMCNSSNNRISSKVYAQTREKVGELIRHRRTGTAHSDETKAKIGSKSRGRHHEQEAKDKLRVFNTGKIVSEITRSKISSLHKGKITSDETRSKISTACRGKPKSKTYCPHCLRLISDCNYPRYHGDNCKHKPN